MESTERIQARLNNIQSVQPVLSALRTISLGSWQLARKQHRAARQYQQRLLQLTPWVLPHLPTPQHADTANMQQPVNILALAIGGERGLCGRFNADIADQAVAYLSEQTDTGRQVSLSVIGSRLLREVQRRQQLVVWSNSFPQHVPQVSKLAFAKTNLWLTQFEAHEIGAVDIIYNTYQGIGQYQPTIARLIPPSLPQADVNNTEEMWPSPIIETEPQQLYAQIMAQTIAISLYSYLLESATAEHAVRFQRMEAATQNAERLAKALSIERQSAQRQAITQEVQALAIGAGLVE